MKMHQTSLRLRTLFGAGFDDTWAVAHALAAIGLALFSILAPTAAAPQQP